MFSLGGFRNYNLLANAPFLGGYSIDSETNSSVSSETYNAEIWGNVGSYDWSTIGSADGLKLTVWDGTYKKGESTVIPLQLDTDVLFSSVPITIDRRYALNKNFNVFISLMEGQFLEVGRLPITNTIAVNISTTPTQHSNVFNINLPISLTDGVWSSSDIKGSFFRTYVQTYESTFEPINLSYVYCVLYDKNNSAIRVETITSFDSNFAPLSITKVRANIPLTFKATSNLNANTQIGEWLEITMQYDY